MRIINFAGITRNKNKVYNFMLTIHNVKGLGLTPEVVTTLINSILPHVKVLIAIQIISKDRIDWTILLISSHGLSKNNYFKLFKQLFSQYPGLQLRVTGVKSIILTLNAILMNMRFQDIRNFYLGEGKRRLWANTSNFEIVKVDGLNFDRKIVKASFNTKIIYVRHIIF